MVRDNVHLIGCKRFLHGFLNTVWSCGVVLFVLLNNKLPFDDERLDAKNLVKRMAQRKYNYRNKSLTGQAREVIALLMTPEPKERPSMQEILANPWFVISRMSTQK